MYPGEVGTEEWLHSIRDVCQTLEGIPAALAEAEEAPPGSLAYLSRDPRWRVFLARGCDTLQVSVCEGLLGKDLYDGLKRVGGLDGARLRQLRWPTSLVWPSASVSPRMASDACCSLSRVILTS